MVPVLATTLFQVPFASAAGSQYFSYNPNETWGGFCPEGHSDTAPQQTPIDIPMNSVDSAINLSFTSLPEGKHLLREVLKTDDAGNMALLLESDVGTEKAPIAAFVHGDIEFKLDHIHSHWGSSEHLVDGKGGHGNFHLVFKAEATPESRWTPLGQPVAVIEVMVEFVSDLDKDVVANFPRCPEVPAGKISSKCTTSAPDTVVSSSDPKLPEQRDRRNLFEALGWSSESFGSTVHYVGSLTTPPCSGPIQWFVQTQPVKIHDPLGDWLGCDQFRNSFPHGDDHSHDMCGNYRPIQPIRDYTTFESVTMSWSPNQHSRRGRKNVCPCQGKLKPKATFLQE